MSGVKQNAGGSGRLAEGRAVPCGQALLWVSFGGGALGGGGRAPQGAEGGCRRAQVTSQHTPFSWGAPTCLMGVTEARPSGQWVWSAYVDLVSPMTSLSVTWCHLCWRCGGALRWRVAALIPGRLSLGAVGKCAGWLREPLWGEPGRRVSGNPGWGAWWARRVRALAHVCRRVP